MKKILLFFCALAFGIQIAKAQTRPVTGKVTEKATGSPLPGVAVTIKGTKAAVSTDANGIYKISIPVTGNTVLVFKSIGFNEMEVAVGAKGQINAALEESATTLNEVKIVNIGYGTVKREAITGAVSSVNAATIAAAPVSSALEAIQGRVAGVNITTTEGSPDAEINVRVRGGGSITQSNEPLYIVDGFPVNSIADIAPQDIESIDILKDASSTAIYGARGANGVVLVTTKSAKDGKTSISYNIFGGYRKIAKTLDVLEPYDYVTWQYEKALLDNTSTALNNYTKYFGNYQDIDLYQNMPANDWQNLVFGRTGNTINHNLSIMGGSDKTKYSLSHSFVKDRAIMQLSGYERQNINFKLNHKLYDKLTLDFGVRYADTKTKGGGTNEVKEYSSADSRLKYAMLYPPVVIPSLTVEDDDVDPDFALYNPLLAVSDNDQYIHRKQYNFSGALSYDIIKDLRLKAEVGYEGNRNDQERFYGTTTYYARNKAEGTDAGKPALILTNGTRNSIRSTNTLNYNFRKLLGKDHSLTVLLGQEFIKLENATLTNIIHGFPKTFTFSDSRVLTTQGNAKSIGNEFFNDDKLLSFFTRANYDYKGKYLLSAAFRTDGSSKFSSGNQWGYFPSVSAAWRIIQEDFMVGTKSWLSDLKLRASYGASGNNNIPAGQIVQTFQSTNTNIFINGASSYWSASNVMANPNLKWETTISRNVGLDFGLFGSKVTASADAYINNVKDLLIQFPVSGTGYEYQYQNIGETQNKGLEFNVNYRAVQKKNFDLGFNFNISFNRNKVVSLGGLNSINSASSGWASTDINQDYLVQVGSALGLIYGYQNAGRYEVSDFSGVSGTTWTLKPGVPDASSVIGTIRPGTIKFVDRTSDGKVTLADRTVIGNANPLNTGGFSLTGRLYDFDFAAYFNWSYGNKVYNANKIEYTSTAKYSYRNLLDIMAIGNRWTNLRADGTISNNPAELEAMNANTTMWSPYTKYYALSDWAVEDGSFLRLSTVTLGYTLPAHLSNKLKMKKLRVYASGNNVFLLTNYTGFDPEVSTRRSTGLTPGVDYSAYPRSRAIVLGLNVNF